MRCVSSTETVNNAQYVQTQCIFLRHAIVEVNVVIGVLVVHGELLVVMRVVPAFLDCDDAVVHRIRSHSCIYRSHCFHVAVSVAIFCIWRYSVYTLPSVTVNSC